MIDPLRALALGFTVLAVTASAPSFAQVATVELSLRSGFTPDPHIVPVRAGGSTPATQLGRRCPGFYPREPQARLNYRAGSLPLIISAASAGDTTLFVKAPDGSFICDDDGGVNGSNPAIRLNTPASGAYEIWVGVHRLLSNTDARLYLSEEGSA